MTYVMLMVFGILYLLYRFHEWRERRLERQRKVVDMGKWLNDRRIDRSPTDAEYAELANAYRKFEEDEPLA